MTLDNMRISPIREPLVASAAEEDEKSLHAKQYTLPVDGEYTSKSRSCTSPFIFLLLNKPFEQYLNRSLNPRLQCWHSVGPLWIQYEISSSVKSTPLTNIVALHDGCLFRLFLPLQMACFHPHYL